MEGSMVFWHESVGHSMALVHKTHAVTPEERTYPWLLVRATLPRKPDVL